MHRSPLGVLATLLGREIVSRGRPRPFHPFGIRGCSTLRRLSLAVVAASAIASGCGDGVAAGDASQLTPERLAAIDRDVRAFMQQVAADVTRVGPEAWRQHFADTPAFFMAGGGHLEFTDSAAATSGLRDVAQSIARIELRWGDPLRVDPLAPGLASVGAPYEEVRADPAGATVDEKGYFTAVAERRANGWQFRNLHWSMAVSAPAP